MPNKFILGTKAETIIRAQKKFGSKFFLEAYFFTVEEWKVSKNQILKNIKKKIQKRKISNC